MARDILFKREAVAKIGVPDTIDRAEVRIEKRRPYRTLHDWFWQVLSLGRLERYEVIREGRVVSWVYCVGRVYQFPFMGAKAIHVGPVYTAPSYRGLGYFRLAVARAMHEHRDSVFWVIVEDDNRSSLRAMRGVGFTRVAYLRQNRATKVFRVEEWLAGGAE